MTPTYPGEKLEREEDSNLRPLGYEPSKLPLLYPANRCDVVGIRPSEHSRFQKRRYVTNLKNTSHGKAATPPSVVPLQSGGKSSTLSVELAKVADGSATFHRLTANYAFADRTSNSPKTVHQRLLSGSVLRYCYCEFSARLFAASSAAFSASYSLCSSRSFSTQR